MPKIKKHQHVEEGQLWGFVETNRVGSMCRFAICPVDEWEGLSEEEAEKVATEALFESGQFEWGY
jgi:hypothetical protein